MKKPTTADIKTGDSRYPLITKKQKNLDQNEKLSAATQFHARPQQSFPYENNCKCYKKLASKLWPVLFTLPYFFLNIHSPVLPQNKKLL